MRSYTCTSPWILTDFITLIKPTGGQFLVFKTVTAWNHWLSYMLSVLFIVCFYTQQMTQNSSIYLLWQFHGFEYQMKNLWIHFWWFSFQCEPREFMHLMKLFFKNSADEVENAPKSLNSQGFHTTFIFGNFTDDIGNMRTLKTPTSPGTLIWALMVHWITRPHSRGNENASRLPPLLLHSVVITHTHIQHTKNWGNIFKNIKLVSCCSLFYAQSVSSEIYCSRDWQEHGLNFDFEVLWEIHVGKTVWDRIIYSTWSEILMGSCR